EAGAEETAPDRIGPHDKRPTPPGQQRRSLEPRRVWCRSRALLRKRSIGVPPICLAIPSLIQVQAAFDLSIGWVANLVILHAQATDRNSCQGARAFRFVSLACPRSRAPAATCRSVPAGR